MGGARSPVANVLVDSSAFFAILNDADRHHRDATQLLGLLADRHLCLATTNFIVAETHALLLARHSHAAATQFLRTLTGGSTVAVIRVQADDEAAAREIVYRYEDRRFSLTDAISFAVMGRLGIGAAFTFDRHFAQFGLEVMRP